MNYISLIIPGSPIGKGRPRFRSVGKFVQTYNDKQTSSYENLVKTTYSQQYSEKSFGDEEMLQVTIDCFYSIPTSATKKKKIKMSNGELRPIVKPDLDNIAKIILDSLNDIAYKDDSRVVDLTIRKHYADSPCVRVQIVGIEEGECSESILLK